MAGGEEKIRGKREREKEKKNEISEGGKNYV